MLISIEHAGLQDIDALVGLLDILFSIEQDFTPNASAQRRGLQLLMVSPDRGQIFVARHRDAGIVGMVSVQLVVSTAMGAPSGWIEDLVIEERFRGEGVGKALLAKASEWAQGKGARRVQLLADADNLPALNFYQHLGMQPTRLFAWKKQME